MPIAETNNDKPKTKSDKLKDYIVAHLRTDEPPRWPSIATLGLTPDELAGREAEAFVLFATQSSVPAAVLAGLSESESSFNPLARSTEDFFGLGQMSNASGTLLYDVPLAVSGFNPQAAWIRILQGDVYTQIQALGGGVRVLVDRAKAAGLAGEALITDVVTHYKGPGVTPAQIDRALTLMQDVALAIDGQVLDWSRL